MKKINKGRMIIGSRGSGKSCLAKGFLTGMEYPEVVYLECGIRLREGAFRFNAITNETKTVVLDECSKKDIPLLLDMIQGFQVDYRNKNPIRVKPEIIAIMNENVTLEDVVGSSSLARRFIIHELKKYFDEER